MGHSHHYSHEAGFRVRCSCKRATAVVCGSNVLVVLYLLHSLLLPLYLTPSSHSSIVLIRLMKYTQAQMNRMKEANKARQAAQPLKLIKLVKELQQESGRVAEDSRTLNAAHQNAAAAELASRLKAKLYNPNNQQGLDKWRRQRLKLIKKREEAALATAQESGQEKEDGIIPGRPLPEECRAEAHTDYDGAAVRWGLTYHVESAADCCQACLDHARSAEGDGKKCNVWVYCPSVDGCYSPDIYEHKHQECWLKQADEPKLNFKGRYDEEYRNQHPTAPVIVPWVSGVIRL
ncbi:unnamed protein product [Sphagnum jensenii]|uniref:Apple domain-containing protein n=1 Tax=Sphagnum jensenii TaxID=128206 RepID=A0ABP0X8Z7_9BRYO